MKSSRIVIGALAVLLALSGCIAASSSSRPQPTPTAARQLHGAVFDPPRVLSDFTVISTEGEPFTLSEREGEFILLYFGYRTCPDFCPTTFTELRQVYLDLDAPVDRLKIVFLTVDPERDDIESMTSYVQGFHSDFVGLRAEDADLQAIMDQFGVVATKRPLGDSALAYLIDHTASVFLINPEGQLAVQYLYGTPYQSIRDDLRALLDLPS